MTREEEKALAALHVMEIEPINSLTRDDLKRQYVKLTKELHPDYNKEVTDRLKYSKMKDAYDYLWDHIDLMNEAIYNKKFPEHATHNYSYFAEPEETADQEKFHTLPVNDSRPTYSGEDLVNTRASVQIQDRPGVLNIVLSILSPFLGFFLFFMTRKLTPKSSYLYLILGLVSLFLNIFIMFFMV